MAIYICAKCLFCFERTGAVENCPDCGAMCIRDADNEEAAEYRRNRIELGDGNAPKDKQQTKIVVAR